MCEGRGKMNGRHRQVCVVQNAPTLRSINYRETPLSKGELWQGIWYAISVKGCRIQLFFLHGSLLICLWKIRNPLVTVHSLKACTRTCRKACTHIWCLCLAPSISWVNWLYLRKEIKSLEGTCTLNKPNIHSFEVSGKFTIAEKMRVNI